jgi:RNA polymerase sigma-70 factor (ECF subfamily)
MNKLDEHSDHKAEQELFASAKAKDRRAMDLLLSRLQPSVYRFGLKMCRNDADAQDILQDTLLAVSKNLEGFRGDSSLATWVYTIARSFCIKKRRRRKDAPARIESLSELDDWHGVHAAEERPDRRFEVRQMEIALDAALAELDIKYREVFVLRDVEGLSAEEVSQVMGLSVQAVKSRLHRAREKVRTRMEPVLFDGVHNVAPPCLDIVKRYSQHLEGEITGSVCETMQKHVDSCESCRAACDSLRKTLAVCRESASRYHSVPPEVQTRVRNYLELATKNQKSDS